MSQEIERKFLVKGKPWEKYSNVKVCNIKQGYLSKSVRHTIRIRLKDNLSPVHGTALFEPRCLIITESRKAFITIKGPRKELACDEFEYEIPYNDGLQMMDMCDGGVVEKTRHTFRDEHGQEWEVDEFGGINAGLVVAEIELKSKDEKVILPSWTRKDVSFDKRYTNAYLSAHAI